MSAAIDVPGALTLDHSGLMVQAAANGLGIAYVPDSFAATLLDAGRLTTVLEDWCPWIPGLALYYPRNAHLPATLRAFLDVVKATREVAPGGTSGASSAAKKPSGARRSKRAAGR